MFALQSRLFVGSPVTFGFSSYEELEGYDLLFPRLLFSMHILRTFAKQTNVEKNAEDMLTLIWTDQGGKAAARVVL